MEDISKQGVPGRTHETCFCIAQMSSSAGLVLLISHLGYVNL